MKGATVADETYAILKTNQGDIEVQLLASYAPKTVKNFVELARGEPEWTHPETDEKVTDRLYDRTVFHRVTADAMIEGRDPLGMGTGGPGYEFNDEIHPAQGFHTPYQVAMADKGPNTNGSRFFITLRPVPRLNSKHTIFGEVVDEASRKVVDAIGATETDDRDRPLKKIVIEKVVIETH